RREVPIALVLAVLNRAPGEPEDEDEDDDQCEIEQAGAGEATQLRSPKRVSSLTTFSAGGTGIGVSATCCAGSPLAGTRSAATASRSSHPPQLRTSSRGAAGDRCREGTTRMSSPTIRKRRPPGRSTPRPPRPGSSTSLRIASRWRRESPGSGPPAST